ncbi:MAG: hypothetical protein K6T90_19545 [Leptolyngbyaceae cyanobacterium HOT.MB2.61]|jgi:hypothetical protein|nr:hypothetical protein [Leptolyngbyaceae cyanobacterium HOT.MB2.61]
MKLNSTVALTLVLLALMIGAGVVSAIWGIALGREALKGVTQPDTRPVNNLAKRGTAARREEFTILREEDIIASARARISGTSKGNKPNTPSNAKKATNVEANKSRFPIVAQSENVVLEVNAVQRQGDFLVMQVSMRNGGDKPVRFLYSFLSVTDDKGQELSASADSLPSELPSSSETFSGTISVPVNLLEGVETLSLTLTDYPDQNLQLSLNNIPVPR